MSDYIKLDDKDDFSPIKRGESGYLFMSRKDLAHPKLTIMHSPTMMVGDLCIVALSRYSKKTYPGGYHSRATVRSWVREAIEEEVKLGLSHIYHARVFLIFTNLPAEYEYGIVIRGSSALYEREQSYSV